MSRRQAAGSAWLAVVLVPTLALAKAPEGALAPLPGLLPSLEALYQELHRAPELSTQEVRTAARLARALKELGFEVTEKVGGTGVVGVLRNGPGPTVLVRTDLDGLPVQEATGLPYASAARGRDPSGAEVPVMHACGHDVHMASWVGAATLLARARAGWRGTLVMVGQPAEERVLGARAMLADRFLERFPRPDFALAIHVTNQLPTGQVAVVPGFALANVDSVDVTLYGRGGHGAAPQVTVDPVVLAARVVLALQTIVSRELDPLDPAVITVGSIHGGTKHNIIPDEVKLQLTVRSYDQAVQRQLLAAIERQVKAEAAAVRAPREPVVQVSVESARALYNDPALAERLARVYRRGLGAGAGVPLRPMMGAEDFGEFGAAAGAPSVMAWVGAPEPAAFARAREEGRFPPGPHTAAFAPDRGPALRVGVTALTLGALELLGTP